MTVSGWLFDAYPLQDKMVIWIKTEGGQAVRLEDDWSHSIYVASEDKQTLQAVSGNKESCQYVKSSQFVDRYEKITDKNKREVLKLNLLDSTKAVALGNMIEELYYDVVRLYNVDVLPPQAYFYERDLFPLAKCSVTGNGKLIWSLQDNLDDTDYEVPNFKIVHLDVKHAKQGRLPRSSDKIDSISIEVGSENINIRQQSEQDALEQLKAEIAKIDPDFVLTIDGDESVFPYLVERAERNRTQLILGRESVPVRPPKEGVTYFSYGRVHYRPSSAILYGRVHFDTHNSFIFDHSSLHGLYELARLCRLPLHNCARATIGRCLSSMQFYQAFKRKMLVPWKPVNTERWKSFNELFIADRGGLIFEPVVGTHENVAEFDFAALYPSIMIRRNVSGETVNCDCCPDSNNIVKDLGYHLCEKRKGIVSQALELPLQKRAKYKQLKKATKDQNKSKIYEARQNALKWIGVVSFGYLGHANSKFGLIDSHIVVCAIDREMLVRAREEIEARGFRSLHGIVDSLWLQKEGATESDYAQLKGPIEKATGHEISFEGIYKWIVFLPSKQNRIAPVPNRYFGCFQHGTIKDRGIETRRHDTPPLFSKFQQKALQLMAEGNNVSEVRALMPKVLDLFEKYKKDLNDSNVPIMDLVFTKSLSKDSAEYLINTVQTAAVNQLDEEGKLLRAGQSLRYVITRNNAKDQMKRSVPVELLNEQSTYDAKRYVELLAEVCNSITEPFGVHVNGHLKTKGSDFQECF